MTQVNKNSAARQKALLENYIDARRSGHLSGYDIRPVTDDSFEHFYILIQPKTGVYKGHSYVLELKTTYGRDSDVSQYPINPPYAHFVTNVFHTNISTDGGSICVDILKDKTKWLPSYSFDAIVQNILILFDEPNNASPYNSTASRCWMDCEKDYKSRKQSLGKKPSFKELDDLHTQCFEPFSEKAKEAVKSNNLTIYYPYFPQLNNNVKLMQEQKEEFESLAFPIEEARRKKKLLADAKEAVEKATKEADKATRDAARAAALAEKTPTEANVAAKIAAETKASEAKALVAKANEAVEKVKGNTVASSVASRVGLNVGSSVNATNATVATNVNQSDEKKEDKKEATVANAPSTEASKAPAKAASRWAKYQK